MTTCAGNNTIAALVAGAIDATAARRLELHLDACVACRELVASLGRGLSAIRDDRLPRAGEQLGRYTIQRVIGVGGMGVVYEAHDATLGRRVAVKLLRPEHARDQQLLGEAQIMARLHHPNIAMVHDVGSANGQLYICMEYIAGITLREWLAERRRSWREIVGVFVAAGRGLDYVHREGLVHLDFKPDNVLIDRSGRVVVTDFGIAHMIGARHAGVIAGTPAYMAPEQRRGGATDARSGISSASARRCARRSRRTRRHGCGACSRAGCRSCARIGSRRCARCSRRSRPVRGGCSAARSRAWRSRRSRWSAGWRCARPARRSSIDRSIAWSSGRCCSGSWSPASPARPRISARAR